MANQKQIIRACLLHEFKVGFNASEACREICMAFGEDAIKERWNRQCEPGGCTPIWKTTFFK
ncbi:hypothetical protein WH47_06921 [Habropoda laboriosa]|uniref:Mos1 transposase HTH domain-containing protein n=1 Tax=Habropoda laboriosa TaxID=597456 RepID=A0A0L7QQ69_9HYME|nr:hypothetical protein WH47_06921 [Habropoda laboriosa]